MNTTYLIDKIDNSSVNFLWSQLYNFNQFCEVWGILNGATFTTCQKQKSCQNLFILLAVEMHSAAVVCVICLSCDTFNYLQCIQFCNLVHHISNLLSPIHSKEEKEICIMPSIVNIVQTQNWKTATKPPRMRSMEIFGKSKRWWLERVLSGQETNMSKNQWI